MIGGSVSQPRFLRSLSARLLMLTVIFVMVSEVLIFLPSVARFRLNYLQEKLSDGRLAMLALQAMPDNSVTSSLAHDILEHVGAYRIVLHQPKASLMLPPGDSPPIDATYNLEDAGFMTLIGDAMFVLGEQKNRILRVLDRAPDDRNLVVEVILDEAPMRLTMWEYGSRIVELSIFISLITAALLYLALQWLLVAPLRRLTASMMAFRAAPEDESRAVVPSRRADELGLA